MGARGRAGLPVLADCTLLINLHNNIAEPVYFVYTVSFVSLGCFITPGDAGDDETTLETSSHTCASEKCSVTRHVEVQHSWSATCAYGVPRVQSCSSRLLAPA